MRAAITRIRDVQMPNGAGPRVRDFLAELTTIHSRLGEMTRTTADGSLKEIGDLGLLLAHRAKRFQDRAEAAGLRECADKREFDAVLDAFTAPVYATQVARFEVWFADALRPWLSYEPATWIDLVRQLRRVNGIVSRAEDRLDDLYRYRPNRAVEADVRLGPPSTATRSSWRWSPIRSTADGDTALRLAPSASGARSPGVSATCEAPSPSSGRRSAPSRSPSRALGRCARPSRTLRSGARPS